MNARVLIGVAAAGLLMQTGEAVSQTASLHGRILEFQTEEPVSGAAVELLDARQRRVARVVSGEDGSFRFEDVREGSYQIRAGASGYRQVTTPTLNVAADEPLDVIVRVAVDVVPLAPLEVVTRAPPLHPNVGVSQFMERARSRMGGHFIMRDQIEEQQPQKVSDLLQMVGSITVLTHGNRTGAVHNTRTQCEPAIYLNRVLLYATTHRMRFRDAGDALDSVHWTELEGIEVYAGAGSLPPEYSGSRGGCGVVALWTRR